MLLPLLAVVGSLASGEEHSSVASLLSLAASARELAMGGASVGLASDAGAVFFNAAALAWLEGPIVASGLEVRPETTTCGELCASYSHLAAGVRYLDFGEVPETDESGNVVGTYSYRNYAFAIGGGICLADLPFVPRSSLAKQLALGLAVKALRVSTLEPGSGSGFALDLPLLLHGSATGLVTSYDAGMVLENLVGSPIRYGSGHEESWPRKLTLGASLQLLDQVIIALDITTERALRFGVEWTPTPAMSLRTGLRNEGVWMWSLGVGVRLGNVIIDLAVVPHPYLRSQLHASLAAFW